MSLKSGNKVEELKQAIENRKRMEEKKAGKVPEAAPQQKATAECPPDQSSIDELMLRFHEVEEESKKHYDHLLRVMAEFENYKKRMAKEQESMVKFANEAFFTEALSVIDDFERVEAHVPKDASEQTKALVEGVLLVHKHLVQVLAKHGLAIVGDDLTKFDPTVHEAIAYVPNETVPAGSIIEVHRRGYKLFDKLIRAAQVTVSSGPAKKA